tara:strand:- start:6685 stop:7854 length:1170 start_codon:yes stop_codon:yes gene_type:complete
MKITVVGMGYVGLSLSVLLSQKYKVTSLDIDKHKITEINSKRSPINDKEIENYLAEKKLNLTATTDKNFAYHDANFIIIATPTNFDPISASFNTSSVEQVILESLAINKKSTIIIKSTIPMGFTDKMRNKFQKRNIIFSPEFLRESKALYDNLYPSRIVLGDDTSEANEFGNMLLECSNNKDNTPIINMSSKEAEAVKLFSNTFLAMRISFFNELDTFSEIENLSAMKIIKGVSSDPRIGNYYNNPSFGYGGYCLPKDTKQLLDNFSNIPNNIISAVVEANKTRKKYIVKSIVNKSPKTVGVYRLIMKEGSDNFRESAVINILEELQKNKIKIFLYEPFLKENIFNGIELISDLKEFISKSNLIIANRLSSDLDHVRNKVYSRDIFQEN